MTRAVRRTIAPVRSWLVFAGLLAGTLAGPLAPPLAAQDPDEPVVSLRELIVSAMRSATEVGEEPVNVTVVTREQLRLSAAKTLQDILQEIPGIDFRLQVPAASAHPSFQAVSLRGLGGTAASRTLVLVDGVPLNDPYFGWVRWSQVPVEAIERVEIVRGGATVSWGGQSLAGVIHIITRSPSRSGLSAGAEYGSQSTFRGDAMASFAGDRVSGYLAGEAFDTDGYILTREDLRGPVDVPSASDHIALRGRIDIEAGDRLRLSAQGSFFDQDKTNALLFQPNSTTAGFGQVGATLATPGGSTLTGNVYYQRQTYDNASANEDPTRSTAEPGLSQHVPSSGLGANVVWAGQAGPHAISAGADVLRVTGEATEEFLFSDGAFQNRRITGGDQVLFGVFAQDRIRLDDRWQVQGGARLDVWRNTDGARQILTIADMDVSVDSIFEDRSEVRLSQNVGVTFAASDRATFRGSLYTGLRVPTLNELYKPFRAAGGVVTEANADLEPERVLGAEIGVDLDLSGRGLLRLTGFWARVSDAILDATIAVAETSGPIAPCGFVPAGGICRQRDNLGTIRSVGLEAELDLRLQGAWRFGGSYELNPTEITEAPGRPEVVGNRSQGSPVHRAMVRFGHMDARVLEAVVTGRYLGTRFDDDLNEAEIDDSFLVDIRVRRVLTDRFELFGSVQNLFDTAAEVSHDRDGFVRVTLPRAVSGGLRLRIAP